MGVTQRDIAKMAGVSVNTVSVVLRGAPNDLIGDATRQRIRDAAKQLRYRPNPHARALGGGKAPIIKLIYELRAVYDSTSHLKGQYLASAMSALGRDVTVVGLLHRQTVAEAVAALTWGSPEAVVIERTAASPEFLRSLCEALHAEGVHVLRANCWTHLPPDEPCDAITVDHADGAVLALTHLIERGHRNIARLEGKDSFLHQASAQVLSQHGLTAQCFTAHYTPSLADRARELATAAREATARLLEQRPEVTALFCDNDMAALGALQAIHRLGLQVPDDLAVIGFFGAPWTEFLPVPLTTIAEPTQEACELAVELLGARLDGYTGPWERAMLAPQLIVRQSTGGTGKTEAS